MNRIEGKLCPLCKESGVNISLKRDVNDPSDVLCKCKNLHIFGVEGLGINVLHSSKEEDKGRRFSIAELQNA